MRSGARATERAGSAGRDLLLAPEGCMSSTCPGQIVYGAEIPFHCATSRKSLPWRKAMEYSVSPFSTR